MAARLLLLLLHRAGVGSTGSRSGCSGGRWFRTSAQSRSPGSSRSECCTSAQRVTHSEGGRGRRGSLLWAAGVFSFLSGTVEQPKDEAERKEEEIILLLKKAKLNVYHGHFQAASRLLHQAVVLAHQTHNTQAIIYTYSLMANVAYVQGQLDNAEKLFKAAMSFMLAGGTPQDDNAVIEMSLKLAAIYAEQKNVEMAEHGFRFCTESLKAKLEKEQELSEEEESMRKETRLLLGLCLDSRARYRASQLQLSQAGQDYQDALDICCQEQGETHPQTLVLMSDLATILDLQGRHDDALKLIQQAVDLGRSAGHPDQHVLLLNLAGILMHTGEQLSTQRLGAALPRGSELG
ncbi:tetratricopeptide repeat protein 19, mitochondrial-like isoform X2 [Gouania willdenowi]|uniref:tetratricopeptide repeat protein 19, mitochondrial-like isoform X2 n=1 Tax=Gouania willdenowi TaxID=441366 RepID=UPI00105486DD|nr:tetratricopeptide repeat protein 19, mitochondrial-like isoform X2 [Gouania willdenowi]